MGSIIFIASLSLFSIAESISFIRAFAAFSSPTYTILPPKKHDVNVKVHIRKNISNAIFLVNSIPPFFTQK